MVSQQEFARDLLLKTDASSCNGTPLSLFGFPGSEPGTGFQGKFGSISLMIQELEVKLKEVVRERKTK